ncbi:hypothetical protein EKO04_005355 [Ascochyta lentis]|uniref:Transmembrane protein n=1 Tax=Ascochyta lentis TaxID=205686 RepID=A0A8H7J3U9_9PLEO|nr:hypothetical protein EKO04_005355 [Ascochyta lentis]
MATAAPLSLLLSLVAFVFRCFMLLCMSPLIGSGPLQAVIKKAFHFFTGSSIEDEVLFEYDDENHIDRSSPDDWEAYRCLGFLVIVFLSAAACQAIFITFTGWLQEQPHSVTQPLPGTTCAHGPHPNGDARHDRSPSTNGSCSSPPPIQIQAEPQVSSSFPVKPFPYKNFDPFYSRGRPLREPGSICPIPITDTRTFLEKDTEREGGNEYVDLYGSFRWQRVPHIEAEDTDVPDTAAADALQLITLPEGDASLADLPAVAVPKSPELPQGLLAIAPGPPKSAENNKKRRASFSYDDGPVEKAPRTVQGTSLFATLGSGASPTLLIAAPEPARSTEASDLPHGPFVYDCRPVEPAPTVAQSTSPFASIGLEILRDAPTAPVSSFERVLEETLRSLDSESEALSEALDCFRKAILAWDSDTYQTPASDIAEWLEMAEEKLTMFTPLNASTQEVHQWVWIQTLGSFYSELQPYGYLFEEHGDDALTSLVSSIYYFVRSLGLQVQAPNFTRPGTPPAVSQQQPTASTGTVEDRQAATSAVSSPPTQTRTLPVVSQPQPSAFGSAIGNLQASTPVATRPMDFEFDVSTLNFEITKEDNEDLPDGGCIETFSKWKSTKTAQSGSQPRANFRGDLGGSDDCRAQRAIKPLSNREASYKSSNS